MTYGITVAKYYTLRKKANIKRVLRHLLKQSNQTSQVDRV